MNLKFDIKDNKFVSYKNRGMRFEKEIQDSNHFYFENNIALITKRATPIKIIKANDEIITEAKFSDTSYLDFEGVYKGKFIAFEAKSTENETSFPLSNIREDQIFYMKEMSKFGGIVFLFVNFSCLNRYFILSAKNLLDFINQEKRKSIPLDYFEKKGYEVNRTLNPPLDYLKFLKNI